MPELVTIPIAIAEVVIEYARPNMKLIMDRAKIVDQLFRSYEPWGIRVDDVEVINEGKPSEQGIKFKIPSKRTSFFFGAGLCKLTRDDADWESANETIKILEIGWNTLQELGEVESGPIKTSIALHIQPKKLRFIELLTPFAPELLASLDPAPVKAVAAVVKWDKRRITVDGSGQLANAVFLRFEREFERNTSFYDIAEQLKTDEDELFAVLGVEEDRP